MSKHWALDLIGKPWEPGARGPDAFDCWGLVYFVYKTSLGEELALHPNIDPKDRLATAKMITNNKGGFVEVAGGKQEFDIVAMGKNSKVQHHVGVFTFANGGGIVHSQDGNGVVFSSLPHIRAQGFSHLIYFRHG